LIESQNHLRDLVDKGYITEAVRVELDAMAETALEEVTGLMEYLQSPEALRNARRSRERRILARSRHKGAHVDTPQSASPDIRRPRIRTAEAAPGKKARAPAARGKKSPEPRTEHELRTVKLNSEP
jgi:hypothetical protein